MGNLQIHLVHNASSFIRGCEYNMYVFPDQSRLKSILMFIHFNVNINQQMQFRQVTI